MPRGRAGRKSGASDRKQAVALNYGAVDELPRVIAQATGELAELLLRMARERNIPIKKDRRLADMLSKLSVGESISPETFRLVAAIISFLYHTDRQWGEKHSFLEPVMAERDSAAEGSE